MMTDYVLTHCTGIISYVNVFLPLWPRGSGIKRHESGYLFKVPASPRPRPSRQPGSSVLAVYSREDILLGLQLALH